MSKRKPFRKKFIFRTIVFLTFLFFYVYDLELLTSITSYSLGFFKVYHVIWLFLMLEMSQVLLPVLNNHISTGKIFARHYKKTKAPYDKKALQNYINKYNIRAVWAALFWLALLLFIGIFLYTGKLEVWSIHLIVVFFYFADEFCINIWCPFGAWIVRSKCCNACRIYNWNFFLIYSPYIFICSFWTYSLLLMSLIILLQWEYLHYKNPQRISEISNANLQCSECPDEGLTTCKY